MNTFENIFPEKFVDVQYKNRHSWMPNSLMKSITNNHILYNQVFSQVILVIIFLSLDFLTT